MGAPTLKEVRDRERKQEDADTKKDEKNPYEYNADEKAEKRESAIVTIGGLEFVRVKKDWNVSREMRKLLRIQDRERSRILRLDARKDALAETIRGVRDETGLGWEKPPIDDDERIQEIEDQVEEFDDRIDDAGDQLDESAYQLISLLLSSKAEPALVTAVPEGEEPGTDDLDPIAVACEKSDEGEWHPHPEFLKRHLDSAEAGDLVRLLTSGGETDPTATIPSD